MSAKPKQIDNKSVMQIPTELDAKVKYRFQKETEFKFFKYFFQELLTQFAEGKIDIKPNNRYKKTKDKGKYKGKKLTKSLFLDRDTNIEMQYIMKKKGFNFQNNFFLELLVAYAEKEIDLDNKI